jgi:hypothetical protein
LASLAGKVLPKTFFLLWPRIFWLRRRLWNIFF